MRALACLTTVALVTTLWGCASVNERPRYTMSDQGVLELTRLATSSSDLLGTEIRKLIDSYRASGEAGLDTKAPGFDKREWLRHLFAVADVEAVRPDSAFEKVKSLSGNQDIDLAEDFFDSLASFVVDDQYHCSRPAYYRYFSDRYGDKRKLQDCNESVPFLVATNLAEPEVVWVDPGSVSSIHLLFAGEGEAMMSQFGHVMFRLVICPDSERGSDACDRNIYQHLVLGYRAHIDDFKIDSLDGVFGGYRAYLFANRFMDVYQEYAIGEFRELYSLPLLLDDKERSDLVRAMSEVHWSYAGEYRFLTSNCSTLAQNFLLNNWREFGELDVMQTVYWRPDAFFSDLKAAPLAAGEKISDLAKAEREGFYFSSAGPIYEQALDTVKEAMAEPDFDTLDEYLMRHPLVRKRDVLSDKKYYQVLWDDHKLLSAQVLLEELAVVRSEQKLMGEVAYFFDTNDVKGIDDHLRNNLDEYDYRVFASCVLSPILKSIGPIRRSNGIPGNSTMLSLEGDAVNCGEQMDKAALKRAISKMGDLDQDNWQKIKSLAEYWVNSINNVAYYSDIENEALAGMVLR